MTPDPDEPTPTAWQPISQRDPISGQNPDSGRTTDGGRDPVSEQAGRYLLALYWLSTNREDRVRTGEVGDRLDVSPSSASEMLARLAADGFVDHRKQYGVVLTPCGETVASSFARRQCIVSNFFEDAAALSLDAKTAYRIGYALPAPATAELCARLDHPCPRTCRRTAQECNGCLVRSLAGE